MPDDIGVLKKEEGTERKSVGRASVDGQSKAGLPSDQKPGYQDHGRGRSAVSPLRGRRRE